MGWEQQQASWAWLTTNMGVPGDWVTGNRMLDVLVLPLVFAVAFPLLRSTLKKHVFQVRQLAVALCINSSSDNQHNYNMSHAVWFTGLLQQVQQACASISSACCLNWLVTLS